MSAKVGYCTFILLVLEGFVDCSARSEEDMSETFDNISNEIGEFKEISSYEKGLLVPQKYLEYAANGSEQFSHFIHITSEHMRKPCEGHELFCDSVKKVLEMLRTDHGKKSCESLTPEIKRLVGMVPSM